MKTVIKRFMILGIYLSSNISMAQLNWVIENANRSSENIKIGDRKSGGKYVLKNTTVEFTSSKYREVLSAILKHGERKVGINLVWGSMTETINNTNFINIERKPGISGPLKTGEPVALRFENGGYLSYASSNVGVDLTFKYGSGTIKSEVPYQFSFFEESGEAGIIVETNIEYALKNISKGDYLIYCNRGYGINLDWRNVCEDGEMSILNEFKNKLPLVESIAKTGKRLYKIVRD